MSLFKSRSAAAQAAARHCLVLHRLEGNIETVMVGQHHDGEWNYAIASDTDSNIYRRKFVAVHLRFIAAYLEGKPLDKRQGAWPPPYKLLPEWYAADAFVTLAITLRLMECAAWSGAELFDGLPMPQQKNFLCWHVPDARGCPCP